MPSNESSQCPLCGSEVPAGQTACAKCGLARNLWKQYEKIWEKGDSPVQPSPVELSLESPEEAGSKKGQKTPKASKVGPNGISAVAMVFKNVIQVDVADEKWLALPVSERKEGILRTLTTLFTTHYQLFRGGEVEPLATVSYLPRKDEIVIEMEGDRWHTEPKKRGVSHITYEGVEYTINETLAGRFQIVAEDRPTIEGMAQFRSISLHEHPEEFRPFFASLSVGMLIRTLFSELGI